MAAANYSRRDVFSGTSSPTHTVPPATNTQEQFGLVRTTKSPAPTEAAPSASTTEPRVAKVRVWVGRIMRHDKTNRDRCRNGAAPHSGRGGFEGRSGPLHRRSRLGGTLRFRTPLAPHGRHARWARGQATPRAQTRTLRRTAAQTRGASARRRQAPRLAQPTLD